MDSNPMDSLEDQVRSCLQGRLRAGFESDSEILEGVAQYLAGEFADVDIRRVAGRIFDSLKKEQFAEEQSWPTITDYDRMQRAFSRLRAQGVLVREDFSCCQSCGFAEIGEEVDKESEPHSLSGFTFYHQQDTESAVDGHGIALAYGALSGEDADSLRVGRMIAAALQEEGFDVKWDGTLSKRICIEMEWKRRRPPHLSR